MARMFADLHCHPTLFGFNRMRNSAEEHDPARNHAWHVPPSNPEAMAEGKRAATYSQIDVAKMSLAGVRICYASITPIETGFFRGNPEKEQNTSFVREALGLTTGATALRSAVALWRDGSMAALKEATAILRNEGPLRVLVQHAVMRYSLSRIRFMVSEDYDYWEEFLKEYQYMVRSNGQEHTAQVEDGHGNTQQAQGRYHLIKDAAHFKSIIDDDNGDMAVILTIEGAHVLTIGPDQERVPDALIFERIETLRTMEHPVLFVTLAHHFDNGICGHAHSMPDAGQLVMDQSRRMGEGMEMQGDLGMRVVKSFLALDNDLNDIEGARRILLDIKHMSPLTRRQYYRHVIEPYNERNPDRPLPVIMSHAAYSGMDSLDTFINNADKETDQWRSGLFNAWGINACDEDVRAIHKSGGLLGLIFEQRILGAPADASLELLPDALMIHLAAVVDVIMLDDRLDDEAKRTIWDCVCLGTDFDGFIDPLSCYPTALSLPRFAQDLRAWLLRNAHTRQIADIGVDELVEKICWRNGYEFALRHLPSGD